MNLTAAFATDDGTLFMNRHFGDADFYDIYEITAEDSEFLKRIPNTSEEENEAVHADPLKAHSVAGLLLKEEVNTAVSKVFGPNIKRIRKKFVCVLSGDETIEGAIRTIQKHMAEIEAEWLEGPDRCHLRLAPDPTWKPMKEEAEWNTMN